MRATATLVLSTSLLLFACSDDKDPLDGMTAASLSATGTTGASASGTGDTATTGAGSDGNSDSAASTGDPPDTTGAGTGLTDPTTASTTDPTTATVTTGDPDDPYEQARQLCVDTINMYRGTLGLTPYQRWTDAEECTDAEAASDGQTQTPHGAFGMCGESAQNECPGWGGPLEESLTSCLAQMWAEGPGDDFNQHGHYINMSSEQYTRVSCGFADAGGEMWMIQNFQ